MIIKELVDALEAEVLCGEGNFTTTIVSACGADLMSDVLAFGHDKTVLITGLVNPQVVRTAEMLDVSCIVFSRGKKPSEEVVELAEECGITIMTTRHTMYVTCGILYSHGIPGGSPKEA